MKKRKLHTNLLLLFVLFFTMGNNPVKAQCTSQRVTNPVIVCTNTLNVDPVKPTIKGV